VSSQLFKMMTGVDMVHVPYRSLPYSDPIGGRVEVFFCDGAFSPCIHQGRYSAGACRDDGDAFGAAARHPERGRVRTGLWRPARGSVSGCLRGTPIEIVDRLNKEINAGLTDPKITARLGEGGSALGGSPADFGKLIAEETEKWGKVNTPGRPWSER
jgi:hypothetical protein